MPDEKRIYVSKENHKKLNYLKIELEKGSVDEVIDELLEFWEKGHQES
ncbi:MAG: hypothetical protein ACE5OZ_00460 [Candidatus Heimdallarchaeota archaeon]